MSKNILVIDDELMIRETFSEYLKAYGYNVFTAENGQNGLEKIKMFIGNNTSIDVVFSDIHMPVMNGLDMLNEIRKLNFSTYFVFITGYYSDLDEESLRKEGVNEVLFKPVELKQLVDTIEHKVN